MGLRSAAWQGANPEKDSVCTRADGGQGGSEEHKDHWTMSQEVQLLVLVLRPHGF